MEARFLFQRVGRRRGNSCGVQDLSPVEHQPVRSVRTQRTIRADPLQPVESTGHGICPVAHT